VAVPETVMGVCAAANRALSVIKTNAANKTRVGAMGFLRGSQGEHLVSEWSVSISTARGNMGRAVFEVE
jgi:hypothetical protein